MNRAQISICLFVKCERSSRERKQVSYRWILLLEASKVLNSAHFLNVPDIIFSTWKSFFYNSKILRTHIQLRWVWEQVNVVKRNTQISVVFQNYSSCGSSGVVPATIVVNAKYRKWVEARKAGQMKMFLLKRRRIFFERISPILIVFPFWIVAIQPKPKEQKCPASYR